MQDAYWIIWLIVSGLFLLGEIFTFAFFLFWFSLGAGAAMLAALLGTGPITQMVVFIVVSGLLVAVSRPFADRITKEQPDGVGAGRLVGAQGTVLEQIDPHTNKGLVRLGQDQWRAESASGEPIDKGVSVRVQRVNGTRLIVDAIREE